MKDSFKLKFHFHEYIEFIEDFYLGRIRVCFVEELRENLIFKGGISKFCLDCGLSYLLASFQFYVNENTNHLPSF